MFNKEVRNTGKQVLGGVSATNTVVTVGVDVHIELLVGLYQGFAIFRGVAQMYVVVGSTMNQEQFTVELVYSVHCR